MSDYTVIYEQDPDGGWGAYVPDLPGVVALGESKPRVAELIQEALEAYAAELREQGRNLPKPLSAAGIARV